MLRVGLTGNIGSGKTMVSEVFKALGVRVFQADTEARKLYDDPEVRQRIRDFFGDEVFSVTGEINRKAMASVVFNDTRKLEFINALIHPLVREKYAGWCADIPSTPYSIYEAAILFETGHYRELDKVICVTAPEGLRVSRVVSRDGISAEEVRQRIARQWSDEKKASLADFVIVNDETRPVIPQVMKIHRELVGLSKRKSSEF